MSQPEYIHNLYPPKKKVAKPRLPILEIGKRVRLQSSSSVAGRPVHGLIGGYRFDAHSAEVLPALASRNGEIDAYVWDTNCDLADLQVSLESEDGSSAQALSAYRLQTNSLEFYQVALKGPEIISDESNIALSLSAHFELTYTTDVFAARLGLLHLVQAQRFLILANGERITLLDSGDEDCPVLYLPYRDDDRPMSWLSENQAAGESKAYDITTSISQSIPVEIHGAAVEGLTVQERYSSYFMQEATPSSAEKTIWTPIYPRISWGWSIRAGCREDGVWDIMRRKLMLPIVDGDGLQIPLWQTNSRACFVG
ncbi:hypothetical protein [Methylomonas sp. MgM2]